MKINLIFPVEFDHYTGGMIHSVVSLVRHFSKSYNVYLLAHSKSEILKLDLNVKHLELQNPWTISIKKPIKTFLTYLEVKKILMQFDYQNTLVFTNNVGSELIFSGFGIYPLSLRRIFISRGGDYKGKTGFFLRLGFKSIFHFVAISKRQIKVLTSIGIDKSRITYIPNGVVVSGYSNYKYIFKKQNNIIISVMGYLMPEKNQELAICALPLLKQKYSNVVLKLYGNDATKGNYTEKLMKIIESNDIKENVIFCGFVSDKYDIFSNTDILLSTSLSEGFGRSIAEAMSFGIPCIGLKESGGLLDIIKNDYNGILIENSPKELFIAISKIVDDLSFREKISANAMSSYLQNFTEENMCRKYDAFLNKILFSK